ncbi:two-component system regulatory protein YycI [Ferviditalea candida]|uniref:Two-component system regulatory protein YycI n=1 Tax=Ferviditalea candida TaxID=3108399 RepID=A0ABU5ZPA2_9BACL|nr:two-component system regulatory protein YycI [Paenibacillaceae bacterium T2]
MEWSRAKTILIMAFLALNILLGYQLWIGKVELEKTTFNSEETTREIQQLMKSKEIRLEAAVSEDTPKLQDISIRFDPAFDPHRMIELEYPFSVNNLYKASEKTKLQQIPRLSDYQLDEGMSNSEVYMMHQLFNGYPMFEVNLKLLVKHGLIDGYQQSLAQIIQNSQNKEQKVLSGMTAIGSLVENYLPRGSVITDVRLGYHGQIFNSETQVLAPSWRIVTRKGDVFYVHAITGAVAAPQKETDAKDK